MKYGDLTILPFIFLSNVDYAIRKHNLILVGPHIFACIEDPDTARATLQTVDCYDYYELTSSKLKTLFTKAFLEAEMGSLKEFEETLFKKGYPPLS